MSIKQIMEQGLSGINWNTAAVILLALLLCLVLLVRGILKRKKQKKYLDRFTEAYDAGAEVIEALEQAGSEFKAQSREAEVIRQALFYLRHSIFMDYETAFSIIEDRFKGNKIRTLHDQVIEKEKEKKSGMLLLTAKN